jgi:hypothetical protein
VDWINGALDDTDASFARLSGALHPDFSMVMPSGSTLDRAGVLQEVRAAHATADVTAPLRIEILNLVERAVNDDSALVTYEERQYAGEQVQSCRASTAYFVHDATAPNGVLWRHLHETMITSA